MLGVLATALFGVVYFWALYNLPIFVAGIRSARRETAGNKIERSRRSAALPTFSVVIPAKSEEKVLPRLLNALLHQDYPAAKLEIVVAEDGSTDATVAICQEFAKISGGRVKAVHSAESRGKPAALNHALAACTGEIVAIFDADNVPEPDALRKAAAYFRDGSVAALQGRTLTLNSDVNMLTKFLSYEDAVACEGWIRGKDALGLFVHMKGSCEFVRRDVLERLGGWKEDCLAEDLEMSAKITEAGHQIRYGSDVRSWQESPESLATILRQRIRWFRGSIDVALSFGRLLGNPSRKSFDAETMFFAPFILILSLMAYILGPIGLAGAGWEVVMAFTLVGWAVLTVTVLVTGVLLMHAAKPRRVKDLLWLPFIYAYWVLQSVLAMWALAKTIMGAPKDWKRTPKTGTVTTSNARLAHFQTTGFAVEKD